MWFYAKDGRKAGPVSDGELDALAASGGIDASTLVWKEGMAEWLPLATARPGVTIPKVGQEACSQCGTFHSPDDLAAMSDLKICGACKLTVVQRIKEGLPLANLDDTWRDNNLVVAEADSSLPKRCFRCNSSDIFLTVNAKMQRSFTISRLFNVQVHFCRACGEKPRMKTWVLGVAFVLGAIPILLAFAGSISSMVAVVAAISVLRTVLSLSSFDMPARLKKSKGTTLWISGAGKPFLDSLPQWPN